MANYTVKLPRLAGHDVPKLLVDFGAWLKSEAYGSVGWFELLAAKVPREWNPDAATRLSKAGFSFLALPEGSLLVLLQHDPKLPAAVVLLGSEGDSATVATSLEAFLVELAKGDTGIDELDEEAPGRKAFASWLKANKVKAPKTKAFDFEVWLDGEAAPAKAAPVKTKASSKGAASGAFATLSPKLREVAELMGRRSDDPAVLKYVTKTLGRKPPKNTTSGDDTSYVEAPKHGIEMCFSHDIPHPLYPPIKLSGRSYQPYLACVWLRADFAEKLPFGVKAGMSAKELPALLGKPKRTIGQGSMKSPLWEHVLDAEKGVVFHVAGRSNGAEVMLEVRGK